MSMSADDDNIEIINGSADGQQDDSDERSLTDLVEQPAKVMRIGTMIKQLLEEVRAAPLDDASRNRLRAIHATSIHELEEGLAPELRAACRLAGGPVPRHPDRAVRPADGGPRAARAHATAAARDDRTGPARRTGPWSWHRAVFVGKVRCP